ncbi:hypothetical protein ACSW83_02295 [Clostridium perfringens]|uniref:hypothetical protein n=1 Tax=Clostridium perfringens TaxID=1502 RepID=UPI00096A8A93|nr:hypothetical protein [Clostridium perfringens]MDK0538725.1 hypothetical protein [Clostridium perfringens]
MNKKVVVFIVEGYSDKEALYGILSELYEEKRFVFSVVNGDITSENSTKPNTIRNKIGECIRAAMNKDKFRRENIGMIIHLVDIDGVYIPNDNVVNNNTVELVYNVDNIETNDVNSIIDRNAKKSQILNCLSTMTTMYKGKNSVPYRMYYMSCNLDHVLYNEQNAEDSRKVQLANDFQDKYIDNPDEFVTFMSNSSFTVLGDYNETWDFIKQDLNSLNRHSNFHLFFNDMEC